MKKNYELDFTDYKTRANYLTKKLIEWTESVDCNHYDHSMIYTTHSVIKIQRCLSVFEMTYVFLLFTMTFAGLSSSFFSVHHPNKYSVNP
jgi:hypothetical protein